MSDDVNGGPTPDPSGDSFDDGTPEGGSSSTMPIVIGVVAAGLGLAIGAGAIGLWWMATPPDEVQVEVTKLREPTDAELDKMCEPLLSDTLADLTEAQDKVVNLKGQVTEKEARVQELEEAMKRGAVAGRKMREELKAAKAELEDLRAKLEVALEEKEEALAELERTVERLKATEDELDQTKEKLSFAEKDVLNKRWTAFVQTAQLEVCDKGRRKKLGKCREAVEAAMGPEVEKAYRHCVKSGQAVPGLFEADRKVERLPDYSQYLNQDERIVRDWYITLCDPTLPEADDFTLALAEVQKKEKAMAAEGGNAGGEATLDEMVDEILPEEGGKDTTPQEGGPDVQPDGNR